jgi:hypothetical protein
MPELPVNGERYDLDAPARALVRRALEAVGL